MVEPDFPIEIKIPGGGKLAAAKIIFSEELYAVIDGNRNRLSATLHWPRFVTGLADTRFFLENCESNFCNKKEAVYLIVISGKIAGVISFNAIDLTRQTGYIGYWIDYTYERNGIVTRSVDALLRYYSSKDILHRFVIKVSVENLASQAVAERLGFEREGVLSRGELIGDRFHDQFIYAKIA